MADEKERLLQERGYFLYQGFHFKPVGRFTKKDGDFFEITRHLKRDVELGMMEDNYSGRQKHPYSHAAFYEASTVKDADIFLCLENQKEYVPCQHELQEYIREPDKKQNRGKAR